jgi:hypothetical protein
MADTSRPSGNPPHFSRRALIRLFAALPLLSIFGLSPRYTASDEFVEVDGWILKRSDLRRKGSR